MPLTVRLPRDFHTPGLVPFNGLFDRQILQILSNLDVKLSRPGKTFQSKVLDQPLEVPAGKAYQVDLWLDPVERAEGNLQVDPGFANGNVAQCG